MPEIVAVSVSDPVHAPVMSEPGAKMSTHVPLLEKLERASFDVVEPTVIALDAEAGE